MEFVLIACIVALLTIPSGSQTLLLVVAVIADIAILTLVLGNLIYGFLSTVGWIKKED